MTGHERTKKHQRNLNITDDERNAKEKQEQELTDEKREKQRIRQHTIDYIYYINSVFPFFQSPDQ